MATDTEDFDTRRKAAEEDLNSRVSDVEEGIKRLRERKGRLEGRDAPQAQIDGVESRIETLEAEKERLEATDPIDEMDEPDPTPKSFHSL